MKATETVWKVKGQGDPVLEVWEDFHGNLWFITEKDIDDTTGLCYGYARLYNMPECAEWGSISIPEIQQAVGKNMVWKVEKEHWCNINSYEAGLLVEVPNE